MFKLEFTKDEIIYLKKVLKNTVRHFEALHMRQKFPPLNLLRDFVKSVETQIENKLKEDSVVDIVDQIYIHVKSNSYYQIVDFATIEKTGEHSIVYKSLKNEKVWVRPMEEFFDGRFKRVEKQT